MCLPISLISFHFTSRTTAFKISIGGFLAYFFLKTQMHKFCWRFQSKEKEMGVCPTQVAIPQI